MQLHVIHIRVLTKISLDRPSAENAIRITIILSFLLARFAFSPLQAADKTMIILLNNFLIELVSINYKNNSVHMATSQRYGQCCAIFFKENISKALPLPFAFTTTSGGHNGSAINNLIWQALLCARINTLCLMSCHGM